SSGFGGYWESMTAAKTCIPCVLPAAYLGAFATRDTSLSAICGLLPAIWGARGALSCGRRDADPLSLPAIHLRGGSSDASFTFIVRPPTETTCALSSKAVPPRQVESCLRECAVRKLDSWWPRWARTPTIRFLSRLAVANR